jgi:hypothetical protein
MERDHQGTEVSFLYVPSVAVVQTLYLQDLYLFDTINPSY